MQFNDHTTIGELRKKYGSIVVIQARRKDHKWTQRELDEMSEFFLRAYPTLSFAVWSRKDGMTEELVEQMRKCFPDLEIRLKEESFGFFIDLGKMDPDEARFCMNKVRNTLKGDYTKEDVLRLMEEFPWLELHPGPVYMAEPEEEPPPLLPVIEE